MKLFYFATLFFIATVIYSCTQKTTEQTTSVQSSTEVQQLDTVATATKVDDPNQPSELAALMREMFTATESIKLAVQQGKIPTDFREKFTKIHSAKPTETEMKDNPYPAMAKIFLESMNPLYDGKDQIKDYNLMIGACLACHQNQCPGPMTRIKKLLLN